MQQRVSSCNKILASSDLTPRERALVLSVRAEAYFDAKQEENALADLEEAIKLWPENGLFQRQHQFLIEKRNRPDGQRNT